MIGKDSPSLNKSEWALFIAIVLVILSLVLISKWTSYRSLEAISRLTASRPAPILAVELSGCVRKQGACQIPQGSSVRTLIRKARVKPLADLENILLDGVRIESLDQILEVPCSIHVPAFEKISIEVRGCVEQNVSLCLPSGSRICDLKKFVALPPDADLTFLKRRRLLENNEVVSIPKRREEAVFEDVND